MDKVNLEDMVDSIYNVDMVDNVNMVDSKYMVNMQKIFVSLRFLKLLVDASGWTKQTW